MYASYIIHSIYYSYSYIINAADGREMEIPDPQAYIAFAFITIVLFRYKQI
jgi:hypothetical protein